VGFEGLTSLINGVGDVGGNIATNFEQHLLQNGGVETRTGDADLVQAARVPHGVFRKFDTFSGRQTAAHHKGDFSSVPLQMDDQLAELAHPHRAVRCFLGTEQTPPKGDDMNGAHERIATRTSFHPIPAKTLIGKIRESVRGLKCLTPTQRTGEVHGR